MILTVIGYTLLTIVILDGLLMWVVDAPSRYPVKRLVYNTTATILGGLMIWLS